MQRYIGNPTMDWQRLGWRRRREVLRYAKQGNRHPDPHVAATAEAWARLELQPVPKKMRIVWVLPATILGAILGDPGIGLGGSIGAQLRDRRHARKIIRVYQDQNDSDET